METKKYRKKPVVVEAIQLCWKNWNAVCDFLGGHINADNPARGDSTASDTCGEVGPTYIELTVTTVHGEKAIVRHGDWIIKDAKPNTFYPCKPDIFTTTYEPVDEQPSSTESNGIKTILVNGIAVPEPLREAPGKGTLVFSPLLNPVGEILGEHFSFTWEGHTHQRRRLDAGLCHLTPDAARQHFEALIAPSRSDAQQAEQVTDEDAAKIIRASQAMDEMEDRYERRLMRFELTKAAMQGLLTHFGTDAPSAVATRAAEYADATPAELERAR